MPLPESPAIPITNGLRLSLKKSLWLIASLRILITIINPTLSIIVYKRSYKNFDPNRFLAEVEKIRWWDIYQCESVDAAVQLFSEKLTRILDQLAPIKTVQTRTRYTPWLSQPTKLLIEQRDQAQSRASSSKLEEDWKVFKSLRNQVTSKLRVEKSNWQQDKLKKSSGNPGVQ